jgi:putative transposase
MNTRVSVWRSRVDRGITSEDVIDTLSELFAMRGVPKHIRSDNGPEFVSYAIRRWLSQVGVETLYIEPGSPWQNGYAESFHCRLRDEFLALEEFESVTAARELTARWKEDYNGVRPHSSLGYQTPAEFAAADHRFASVPAASVPAPANACASTPAAHAARDEALPVP